MSVLRNTIVFPALLLSVGGTAYADQWVKPQNAVEFVKPSTVFSVLPEYDVTAPQTGELTGLGLRVHFDSSKFSFGIMDEVFSSGLQGVSDAQFDSDDFDNDPATDMYVSAGWLDLSAKWPGNDVIPLTLYDLSMVALPDFSGVSYINFSDSSHATSGEFKSESMAVCSMPKVTLSNTQGMASPDTSAIIITDNVLNGLEVSIPVAMPEACGNIEVNVLAEGTLTSNLTVEIPVGETSSGIPDIDILPEDFSMTVSLVDGAQYWFDSSAASFQFEVQRSLTDVVMLPLNDEIAEGQNKQVFTLERTGTDLSEPLMVEYELAGTAELTQDYSFEIDERSISVSGDEKNVVFEIPEMTESITVSVIAHTDSVVEGDESLILAAIESEDYVVTPLEWELVLKDTTVNSIATIDIDVLDSIAIEDEQKAASFALNRNGGVLTDALVLSLQENTASGAKYGEDYQLQIDGVNYAGTFVDNTFLIEIPANKSGIVISIIPIADSLEEPNEALQLTLLESASYSAAQTSIDLSVHDESLDAVEIPDDVDAGDSASQSPDNKPAISLVVIDPEAREKEKKAAKFNLTRSGDTSQAFTVALEISGKAKLGEDYHLQIAGKDYEGNNEINIVMFDIPAGEAELEISIVPVDDDHGEGWESIQLVIAKSGDYDTQTPDEFAFVVIDNDDMPSVNIPTVSEWMLFLVMLGLIGVAVTQRDKLEFKEK